MMNSSRVKGGYLVQLVVLILVAVVAGCRTPDDIPAAPEVSESGFFETPALTATPEPTGPPTGTDLELTDDEIATLSSLRKVDDYPLYVMRFEGAHEYRAASPEGGAGEPTSSIGQDIDEIWTCSLFAAFGDRASMLYGRNFDWRFSPALLLFMDPPEKFASVAMVDIEYLGFEGVHSNEIDNLPLEERAALLDAPRIPFDGMNEMGLVVGMAAVPPGGMEPDPDRQTIGSLGVIREVLDNAANTQEAVDIMTGFNIDMGSGPPLHYLIADSTGDGALVEFYQGEMVVIPNDGPYHRATNFIRSAEGDSAEGACWRYDAIGQRLEESSGRLTMTEAMELLESVSQPNTQWSIVYGQNERDVLVAVGRNYDDLYAFDSDGNLK